MNPLVSIIIPTYNSAGMNCIVHAEKFLGRCLESVYRQKYVSIEVLAADNNLQSNYHGR